MSRVMLGRGGMTIVFAAILFVAGCKNETASTYPVTGTVKFADGKPVPRVMVLFHSPGGRIATGMTNLQGQFSSLTTFATNDGVQAGDCIVTLSLAPSGMPSELTEAPEKPELQFSVDYLNKKTSGLSAKVRAGGQNHFGFVLTKPKDMVTNINVDSEADGGGDGSDAE